MDKGVIINIYNEKVVIANLFEDIKFKDRLKCLLFPKRIVFNFMGEIEYNEKVKKWI